MEDYLDKIIYLIAGIVFFWIRSVNSSNADEGPTTNETPESDGPNTWLGEASRAPAVTAPSPQTTLEKVSMPPRYASSAKSTTQGPANKKINRISRRYSGWKRAIIMGELIRPYH